MHDAGAGTVQRPVTQRAGGRQLGPLVVLHAAPSGALFEQVPAMAALHVPLAGQTA
jgi:hypothetical protein